MRAWTSNGVVKSTATPRWAKVDGANSAGFSIICPKISADDIQKLSQGNRIWSLRLLKAGSTSWGSGAINSDRGCRNAEEPASVRSFARRKGSSAVNHLPDFSYAIALRWLVFLVVGIGDEHRGQPVEGQHPVGLGILD